MDNFIMRPVERARQVSADPKARTVLIIEDDTLTRVTLCKLFNKYNYLTVEACNGHMGLKMFKTHKPAIVLTDLMMPDKDGLSTIAEMRAADKKAFIIAMTSGGKTHNMSFLALAKELGADHTLSKPFYPAELLQLLQNLEDPTEKSDAK